MLPALLTVLLSQLPPPVVPPAGRVEAAPKALASAPLEVRVLEEQKPEAVLLEAKALSCDGVALPNASLEVRARDRRLQAGAQFCEVVLAEGAVRTIFQGVKQAWPGSLRVVNQLELLRLINLVDPEDYVPSVVSNAGEGLPPAALEAVAVAARTFAVASRGRHRDDSYDLSAREPGYLYTGLEGVSRPAREAAARTRGEVLWVGRMFLKPAFVHPVSGGATSTALDVMGEAGAGAPVKDATKQGPRCAELPDFAWEWSVQRPDFAAGLGLPPDGEAFEVLARDRGGRVLELKAFGRRFRGLAFLERVQQVFGVPSLRSMALTASEVEGIVTFKGRGAGHGVGLSLCGARLLAEKGATAKVILTTYFPDCEVRVR